MVFNCDTIKLRRGSKNDDVTELQTYLKKRGWYTRQIDGDFGQYTEEAVKKFQETYKITKDGVFGSESCRKYKAVRNKEKAEEEKKKKVYGEVEKVPHEYNPYLEVIEANLLLKREMIIPPADNENADAGTGTTENAEAENTENTQNNNSTQTTTTQAAATTGTDTTNTDTTNTSTDTESTDSTEQATSNAEDIMAATKAEIREEKDNLRNYQIQTFISISSNDDLADLSHEATLKLIYSVERWKELIPNRCCTLQIYRKGTGYTLDGYIKSVKRNQENNVPQIEIQISGYNIFLQQSLTIQGTGLKSQLLQKICDRIGLNLELDLTGLKDDNYTIKASSTGNTSSNLTGTATGTTDKNKLIEIGNQLGKKYHFCSGRAQSYTDMKAQGCGSCFAWSGALYTELKAAGFTVRVVEYATHVPNHRSVEYKDESGNWVDYPYRETCIEKGARNTSNRNRTVVLNENGEGATNIL